MWRRLPVVAFVFAVALPACSSAERDVTDAPSPSSSPQSRASPVDVHTTLGLDLFIEGRIVEVTDGDEMVLADWPGRAAPYIAPSRARRGYVGLAYGPRGVALWFVTARGDERLARPVAQGFGLSAGGRRISFGLADLSRIDAPSRLMILGGPGFGRVHSVLRMDTFGAGAGWFVGQRVFVGWGDGGHVVLAMWDPRSGEIMRIPRFTHAGPTDPATGRVVMYYGDGGCWTVGRWLGRRPSLLPLTRVQRCSRAMTLSPSATLLAGVTGAVDGGLSGSERTRVLVLDAADTRPLFRGDPIPGAYQVGWEDESHLLVLARQEDGDVLVHRCNAATEHCASIWAIDADDERYEVWLVREPPPSRSDR